MQDASHVAREPLPHHDSENGDVRGVVGHRVGGYLPAVHPQAMGDVEHRERARVVQLERHDRYRRTVCQDVDLFFLGDLPGKPLGCARQRLHDVGVAGAPESQEVVVLADDLIAGTREVESEGGHVAAEVIDAEHQVLGEVLLATPDHETDSGISESVLVPADVDRNHARHPEVPFHIGMQERQYKTTTGRVDVDRDVRAAIGRELVQSGGDLFDRFEFACVRGPGDHHDADRVLVHRLGHLLGGDDVATLLHRQIARFDLEITAELLPDHLNVAAEDEVRCATRLLLAPAPFEGEPAEHHGLR